MERTPLTKFGFDPDREAEKLQRLSSAEQINYLVRELESHELHVVRNHVVSLPYYYWLSDEEKIFTNREKTSKLELDERERGGYFKIGIPKALRLAQENRNKLVFLYSPIGPASFDYPPDPDYAKPYKIGQLYLIYSDGDRINNISISLDQQGEDVWLREVFGDGYLAYMNSAEDEIEKIKRFITTPVLTDKSMEDFLNHDWLNQQLIIFHNKSFGKERFFTVTDAINELRKSLTGQLKSQINLELIAAKAVGDSGRQVAPSDIDWAYKTMIGAVMKKEGVNEIHMGGGCGGGVVKSSDLFGFSPVDKLMEVPNLSSSYRRQTLTKENNSKDADRYDDYECPRCHKIIQGELKNHPESWHVECPHCHHQFNCKKHS